MSTHEAKVIKINEILRHDNAENLEIIPVWGFSCCVRKNSFKVGDLAVYIEPETIVDLSRPEFSFLQKPGQERKQHRISVVRLRGVYSQGLLLPAPNGMKEGDNSWDHFGLLHYDPETSCEFNTESAPVKGPGGFFPTYDLENWRKCGGLFELGEEVWVSEKLHGTSARYKWNEDKNELAVSTHYRWVLKEEKSIWWQAANQHPWIEEFCRANPNLTLYGEVFGNVKNFRYGAKPNEIFFRVFDIWDGSKWMNSEDLLKVEGIVLVPTLYVGPYNKGMVLKYTDGNTTFEADHVREGCVIKPMKERNVHAGRVSFKSVSNAYLEMK